MCLITEQSEPFIAKKDITVYKAVCSNRKPYFFKESSIVYDDGSIFDQPIKTNNSVCFADSIAQLAYFNLTTKLISYGEGIHYSKTHSRARQASGKDAIIIKCVIPKGSEYYEDISGLGITNSLKVIKKI